MELSDTVRRLAFAYKSHESAISIPGLEVLVRQPNYSWSRRLDSFAVNRASNIRRSRCASVTKRGC
jgi:hypothetical protein